MTCAIEWTPDPQVPSGGTPTWYPIYRKILEAGRAVRAIRIKSAELLPLLDAVGGKGMDTPPPPPQTGTHSPLPPGGTKEEAADVRWTEPPSWSARYNGGYHTHRESALDR